MNEIKHSDTVPLAESPFIHLSCITEFYRTIANPEVRGSPFHLDHMVPCVFPLDVVSSKQHSCWDRASISGRNLSSGRSPVSVYCPLRHRISLHSVTRFADWSTRQRVVEVRLPLSAPLPPSDWHPHGHFIRALDNTSIFRRLGVYGDVPSGRLSEPTRRPFPMVVSPDTKFPRTSNRGSGSASATKTRSSPPAESRADVGRP